MQKIAHFGTFDVENYGDLLFPLVLERRLEGLEAEVIHVSPVGGAPVWGDCVESVPVERVLEETDGLAAVVVGGGHILHADPTRLPSYDRGGLRSWLAYPSLWLAPSYLAATCKIPLWWNGPGVPSPFSGANRGLLRWAAGLCDYRAVRDRYSQGLLQEVGVPGRVEVVPDTAWDVWRLWTPAELDRAYEESFRDLGAAVPERAIVVHLNKRYVNEDLDVVARRLERICGARDAEAVLIGIGPCHGDDALARQVAGRMDLPVHVIDRPKSLRQVAACIGRAAAYVGSSLHGMITACSFGVPGLVVASEEKARFRKFSGFLEQVGLDSCLCRSWHDAEAALTATPGNPRPVDPAARAWVDAALDRHWEGVRRLLTRQVDDPPAREARKQTALTHLERLEGSRLSAHPAMRLVVADRAERLARETPEAGHRRDWALARLERLVAEASKTTRRSDERLLRLEHLATEAAERKDQEFARLEARLVEALKSADRKQQDLLRLTMLFEKLVSAVEDLLKSRPWRIGTRLHGISRRLRRKPPVPRLPGIFPDLFGQFQRFKQGLLVGQAEAKPTALAQGPRQAAPSGAAPRAGVVVCVHNALDEVRACLESVLKHTGARHPIYLVDDGSDTECRDYLVAWAQAHGQVHLIRNPSPRGYTEAANQGLRAAEAGVDYVVLLNSDTVVTPGWLEGLIECGQSHPRIGIVGPLSNAASWQSIPRRFGPGGDWAVNHLPAGWTAQEMAECLRAVSPRQFPRVPLLNGFCLAIKRQVIEAAGYLDEEAFPEGYGEENDFCLRAADRGYRLAVADQVYVFHAKSRSYSHARRRLLAKRGGEALKRKHGSQRIEQATQTLRHQPVLAEVRRRFAARLQAPPPAPAAARRPLKILFLLPVAGGGGGVHSVVQESSGMRRLGVEARVAVDRRHRARYLSQYPELAAPEELFLFYGSKRELISLAGEFDVVVATIWTSAELARKVVERSPGVTPACYVQDYEPRFYAPGSADWQAARSSYTLVPGMVHFAKTRWICREVEREHGVRVAKVSPSLDHDVYYADLGRPRGGDVTRVAAMIRPSTPRRGAPRTMRVLKRLVHELPGRVEVHTFGCEGSQLAQHGLETDFDFVDHGTLLREGVGGLLRGSDIFVDLSDYQAFGRTGLEAMACGCAVVVPREGGADEYALDRQNALFADTADEAHCLAVLRKLVEDRALRQGIQTEGLRKAAEYSIHRAVVSELAVLGRDRAERPEKVSPRPHALERAA